MSASGAERRDPAALAAEVARAARRPGAARTLLLDVDGTLAPIAPTPDAARVPGATLEAVAALVGGRWCVCAVSGRPADEVRAMLPVDGVRVYGSHGLEAGGRPPCVPAELLDRVERIGAGLRGLAASWPGVRVERKPAGLAVHDRQLDDARLAAWHCARDRWLAGRELAGLEALDGKRVLELRPAGFDKGRVVALVAETLALPGRDTSFVAIGDDATDEDMFRAIRERGLGVLVGPARPTAAAARLDGPAAVAGFLAALGGG